MQAKSIADAEAELAVIERELAKVLPLQRRGEQLRVLIELWRKLYVDADGAPAVATVPVAPLMTRAPKLGTQKERILDAAEQFIQASGGAATTRALLTRLESLAIEVGGADKVGGLSAILSRADHFKSDRAAGGWVLVQPHKKVTPPSAPTLAGS